jgi:hypothetical protein
MQETQWRRRIKTYEAEPSWEALWEVYPEEPAPDWVKMRWLEEYFGYIDLFELDLTATESGIGPEWFDKEELYPQVWELHLKRTEEVVTAWRFREMAQNQTLLYSEELYNSILEIIQKTDPIPGRRGTIEGGRTIPQSITDKLFPYLKDLIQMEGFSDLPAWRIVSFVHGIMHIRSCDLAGQIAERPALPIFMPEKTTIPDLVTHLEEKRDRLRARQVGSLSFDEEDAIAAGVDPEHGAYITLLHSIFTPQGDRPKEKEKDFKDALRKLRPPKRGRFTIKK